MKPIHFLYLVLFLSACKGNEPQSATNATTQSVASITLTPAQVKNAQIATAPATKAPLSGTLSLNGRIEVPPQNLVSVSVPLGGVLRETHLLEGMHIRKGEVIAVLEDPQYVQLQQDFLIAQTELELAQGEYSRQEGLNQSKSASDKVFQQAKSVWQTKKIMVQSLGEKLRLLGIDPGKLTESNLSRTVLLRSPIDGYVSKVSVNIGKYVQPTEVLFELVNPADIHLALTVFEKDLEALSIGQQLEAHTNEHPEVKYTCKVLLIGKNLNQDRSTTVHCHFDQYDQRLVPGMYMNATVQVNNRTVLSIPTDAVQRYEGKEVVFMEVKPGVYQMVKIETGIQANGLTEVVGSVQPLTLPVVVKGAYTLLMQHINKTEE